jgi:hypothetical protein
VFFTVLKHTKTIKFYNITILENILLFEKKFFCVASFICYGGKIIITTIIVEIKSVFFFEALVYKSVVK